MKKKKKILTEELPRDNQIDPTETLRRAREEYNLFSIRKLLSFKARLQLADSLIMGKLGYLICLWGNTTDNQIRKAQITQNLAVRFVVNKIDNSEDR